MKKLLNIVLLLLVSLSLAGCFGTTTYTTIRQDHLQPIEIPGQYLAQQHPDAPLDPDKFAKLGKDEQVHELSQYVIYLLGVINNSNINISSLSDWTRDYNLRVDEFNKKEEARVKAVTGGQ